MNTILTKQATTIAQRILVVEDNSEQLGLIERMLVSRGHTVYGFQDGDAALGGLAAQQPDVIVLDIDTPGIDAIELLENVPRHCAGDPAIIMISGRAAHERTVQSLFQGADDYVRKPYALLELLVRIERQVQFRRLKAENEKFKSEQKLFERFLSKDFVTDLSAGKITTEIGGTVADASILMLDLRDSTSIAEKLEPDAFARFLTDFFSDIADLVYGGGGSINSFTGDGFVVTFGVPAGDTDDHALACAQCALRIRKHLLAYNEFRPAFLEEPVRVGMGIATGQVFAGNVGSIHRLDFTVLGDPPNLASRLESLTKLAEVDLLIDGETRDRLGEAALVTPMAFDQIRGKINRVRIFALSELSGNNNGENQ